VDTYCTGKIPEERIVELVRKHFDLRPAAIIHNLDLRRPIYRQLAAYGHMGRVELGICPGKSWTRRKPCGRMRVSR
jgi:S-adenosylmethionine synthetase